MRLPCIPAPRGCRRTEYCRLLRHEQTVRRVGRTGSQECDGVHGCLLQRCTARRGYVGLGTRCGHQAPRCGAEGEHGGVLGGQCRRDGLSLHREGTRPLHLLPAEEVAGEQGQRHLGRTGQLHPREGVTGVHRHQRQEPNSDRSLIGRTGRRMEEYEAEVRLLNIYTKRLKIGKSAKNEGKLNFSQNS